MYTVPEDEEMVEVCTVVSVPSESCPIQFPFDISFQSSDGYKGPFYIDHTCM